MLGMVRFFFDLHQIKPHGPPTLEGVNGGKGSFLKQLGLSFLSILTPGPMN